MKKLFSEFKIFDKVINVEYVNNIDDTGLGRSYSFLNKIKIAEKWNGELIPDSAKEQTLIHESVHIILDELGYSDLSNDEKFVQSFSNALHQLINSAK